MLQALLNDHQLYHSELQMDYFITTRSGGTQYGMYKQALRELHKRYRGLKQMYADRELLLIDIEELVTTCDKREKIELVKKRMQLDDSNRSIRDTEREFNHFYAQAAALKGEIGELTPKRRAELDLDMWIFKAKEQAAIDYLTTGRLTSKTIELVQYLPVDVRGNLQEFTRDGEEVIAWFNTTEYNTPSIAIDSGAYKMIEGDNE